jgi:uncharacterized protein
MVSRALRAGQDLAEAVVASLPSPDFSQSRVLVQTANRPWPQPAEPWLMAQTWRDLLFAHWALPSEAVTGIAPPALTLDPFDGQAWIGITPFEVSGLRPRGAPPVPRLSRFPELNVRTYVSLVGKPSIFFLSLDAASSLAVHAARRSYRLPYFRARMMIERAGGEIRYACERVSRDGEPADFAAEYQPSSEPLQAEPGSLEYFLTERYCLYTIDEAGRPLRADIQHPPWPLQNASATIRANTMTRPWRIELPAEPPVLHYSGVQRVVIWPLRPAD